MAENTDVPEPDDTVTAPAVPAPAPAAPAGPRIRDRVFSFRSMVAVGIATLLLGGAGGAALVAVTGDDHPDRARIGRTGGHGNGDRGGPQFRPGVPDQQQAPPQPPGNPS